MIDFSRISAAIAFSSSISKFEIKLFSFSRCLRDVNKLFLVYILRKYTTKSNQNSSGVSEIVFTMRAIPKWVEKIHEHSDKADLARYIKVKPNSCQIH